MRTLFCFQSNVQQKHEMNQPVHTLTPQNPVLSSSVCLRQNEVRFVKVPKDFWRSVTASPWFDPRTEPRRTD